MNVKQRASELRTDLKGLYPDVKFSITIEHYSLININIMLAPEKYNFRNGQYVNELYLEEYFEGEALEMLGNIWNIANKGVKYFETADYGTQPSFYVNINIGKSDKPFKSLEQIAEEKKQNKILS